MSVPFILPEANKKPKPPAKLGRIGCISFILESTVLE